MTTSTGGSSDIQAVHRVAEILRLFSVNLPQLTISEAAIRLGMNRSTTHRYFNSLVLDNVLERSREDSMAFVPGPLLVQLGAFAQGQRSVIEIAPSYLRALSRETQLTSVLSLWGDSGAVVSLVSETGTHPILITVRIGSTLDLESAQTRLFVSLLKDHETVTRFLAGFPRAQRERFEAERDSCRASGVCRNEMPTIDSVILAAAVFDNQEIAATVGLIGTTSSLPSDAVAKRSALVGTAYALTEELGGVDTWQETINEPGFGTA